MVSKATVINIEGITDFISSVAFLDHTQIPELVLSIIPVYKQFFENNTDQAINLVNFDFMCNICGMDLFNGKKSKIDSTNNTVKKFVGIIPDKKLASVISTSNVHEWHAIKYIMYLIYCFDKRKYTVIIESIDQDQLSDKVTNSWDQSHEISLIFRFLATANTSIAKDFLSINKDKVVVCE